jgi:hypothetical protein
VAPGPASATETVPDPREQTTAGALIAVDGRDTTSIDFVRVTGGQPMLLPIARVTSRRPAGPAVKKTVRVP